MAWDTRCRNVDVARLLRPRMNASTTIIDAGCGEYGLSAFLPVRTVVGVDVLATDARADNFVFVHGSILTIPFADRSFEIAASVDVMEHLPADLRESAVTELVRVASRAVVITFPSGTAARAADETYFRELTAAGEAIPDWLSEHLAAPYPNAKEVSEIVERAAQKTGRTAKISIHYSERLTIAERLRGASRRSKYLYLAANFGAGLLLPLIGRADESSAYRAIVMADLSD